MARQIGIEMEVEDQRGENLGLRLDRGVVVDFDELDVSKEEEKREEGEEGTKESLSCRFSRIQELLSSRLLQRNLSLAKRADGTLLELQNDLEQQLGTGEAEDDDSESEDDP